jgi:hypothetical protein
MIKKNDIILIGVIVVLALAVILFLNLSSKEGNRVVVTVDKKLYQTFDLNKDTTFTVEDGKGGFNTFIIKNGTVDMQEASCPDRICVNHKPIHYNNETIVCLPNKVVLTIESVENSGVDAVAN